MKKPKRKTQHRDILTPHEIGIQNQAQQHLQERRDLQKSRGKNSDLTPRYWNPKTKQYDILAEWDPAMKNWKRPNA